MEPTALSGAAYTSVHAAGCASFAFDALSRIKRSAGVVLCAVGMLLGYCAAMPSALSSRLPRSKVGPAIFRLFYLCLQE